MTSNISRRTLITIRCDSCGETTQEAVSRLIPKNNMACPFCGNRIGLESGENAIRIQEIAEQLADLGATTGKKSQ